MSKVNLRDVYQEFRSANSIPSQYAKNLLTDEIENRLTENGYDIYNGKVRKCLTKDNRFYFYHTDQLSAFDRHIGHVPYKGSILAAITRFWMENLTDIVPTHYSNMVDERILEVKKLTPFKVEVIVRGYLAGSMMRAYNKGTRDFCGNQLPEGLSNYGSLPQAIITPTSKADVGEHDEETTEQDLIAHGIVTNAEWQQITDMALKIFERGSQVYRDRGWILVDTKYEFGKDENGKVYLMDEAHTPDSSRLWVESTYESRRQKGEAPDMLDKEIIRRELMEKGFSGEGDIPPVTVSSLIGLGEVYLEVLEKLIGESFSIDRESSFPSKSMA